MYTRRVSSNSAYVIIEKKKKKKKRKCAPTENCKSCNPRDSRLCADQKAVLQDILLHHQNGQYATPNLLPPSPRALQPTTDPLLLTPVLTPHLTSGAPNLPAQSQIGPPLVPLSHEHSPAGINTLYSSLQSAPKKRKLSQDRLIHVKQVHSNNAPRIIARSPPVSRRSLTIVLSVRTQGT